VGCGSGRKREKNGVGERDRVNMAGEGRKKRKRVENWCWVRGERN
jgi:hypothetical protein